jgi:hypothetical protein
MKKNKKQEIEKIEERRIEGEKQKLEELQS